MLRKPVLQLSLLAFVSLFVYLSVLVVPYSLLQWWSHPHLNIAEIKDYSPRAGASFVTAFLLLFLLYWLATRLVLRAHGMRMWVVIIGAAVLFNAAMLFLYPVDSADVFDNILRGRMTALYGANPFYQRPSSLPVVRSDLFYRYSSWLDYPTAYGPGWEMVAAGIVRLSGDDVIANVLAFKLVLLAFSAATLAIIAWLLVQLAPNRALYGVTLFAWNPLAIYAIAGNAHNDIVMILFVILGFALLARRHYTLAAMAETVAALVKFIPALVVPIVLIAGLRQARGWRERLSYLALTGAACATLIVVFYGPFWRGGDILGSGWRSHMFTTSLPTLVRVSLAPLLGAPLTDAFVSRAALFVTAVFVLAQSLALWRQGRTRVEWTHYVNAGLSITLFFLLVGCTWFQPWYTLWPLALAALLPENMLTQGAVVFSIAAAGKMPVFDFVMGVRPGNVPPVSIREWQITIGTLGVAWTYFTYQILFKAVRHGPECGIASVE